MAGEVLSVTLESGTGTDGAGGSLVVRLSGRFDGAGAALFDAAVLPLLAGTGSGAPAGVVLDFGGVSYLSSAGIRSVVRAGQAAGRAGAALVLASLTPFVAQVLDHSGLLGMLTVVASVEEGLRVACRRAGGDSSPQTAVAGGRRYLVTKQAAGGAPLEAWGTPGGATLESPSLSELGIALGVGGLGASRAEALPALGPFLSSGRVVALAPADGRGEPDYLVTARPAEATFHVAWGTGIAGDPALLVELPGGRVTAGELASELVTLAGRAEIAFVVVSGAEGVLGTVAESVDELRSGRGVSRAFPAATGVVAVAVAVGLAGPGFSAHAVALSEAPPSGTAGGPVGDALAAALVLEHLSGVVVLDPSTVLISPRAWVWAPGGVVRGAAKMTAVELVDEEPFPDEWLAIARRIYSDSSRVRLRRLAGGFSSSAFQAESWDREGRRTIPTVLKIASHSFTEREEKAYHACVKSFILNNATVIMGRAAEGDWAGLRYNFLGVNGPESRLAWLGDRFEARPFDEVEPLLEALFGRILAPWYEQTREEEVDLRSEHDPSGLFTRLAEDARDVLGIDPGAETIACPEVGAFLPNPYRFLRQPPEDRQRSRLAWPVCITHGDLNLNNVLLDEKENIYVIDFSETRPRNAVADFARLEALVTLQTTRVESEADAARVCRFFAGLVGVGTLDEQPPLATDGLDPAVEKAGRFVACLRRHAARVVAPRRDLVPYLWPLLQWTVPIVSFRQIPPLRKRVSMVASALVVRRILEG